MPRNCFWSLNENIEDGTKTGVRNRARLRRYRIDRSRHRLSAADRSKGKSYPFCHEVPPGLHCDLTDGDG